MKDRRSLADSFPAYVWVVWLTLGLFLALQAQASDGLSLSLKNYLAEVQAEDLGIRSAERSIEAATLKTGEAGLPTSWMAFADANFNNVHQWQNQVFAPDQTYRNQYRLGVSKTFDFGLAASMGYQFHYEHDVLLSATQASFFRFTQFHFASPFVELRIPLWKGFLGADVRAQEAVASAGLMAKRYGDSFSRKAQLAQAEVAYWRLVSMREIARVTQGMVQRAEKLVQWATRREQLHLTDRADVLATRSLLHLKKTDLQRAQDEVRSASLRFNALRGRVNEEVPETLETMDGSSIRKLSVPQRAELREDVLAAKEQARAAEAGTEMARQRITPTLEAFANLTSTGLDSGLGGSIGNSFKFDRNNTTFGLRFSSSLSIGAVGDAKEGYLREQAAADLQFQKKLQDAETEWRDLVARFQEAKQRSVLVEEFEALQREKVEYETERLSRGRTVTAQVINFEQDYMAAQNLRIQNLLEMMSTYIQMKLFQGSAS